MTKIIVDFVTPAAEGGFAPVMEAAGAAKAAPRNHGLGQCSCGGDNFVVVSEMKSDEVEGIPPSRMFECVGCGAYRLG